MEVLKRQYEANPQEFFRQHLDRDRDLRKAGSDNGVGRQPTAPATPLPTLPMQPTFWQKLSDSIARSRTVPSPRQRSAAASGGSAGQAESTTTVNWGDFRGCEFMPPYASEFLGVYAPGSPAPSVADRDRALRDIELYCSQLAHDGVNGVRVWYPYQSYHYVTAHLSPLLCIKLDDILQALHRHKIKAIVTLGNSFGTGALETGPPDPTIKTYLGDQASPPLPHASNRLITSHKHPWKIQFGFYQSPGGDVIAGDTGFDGPGNLAFSAFVNTMTHTGPWIDYLDDVVAVTSRPAFVACEVWNEPEGASGAGTQTNPGHPKIAQLINEAVLKLQPTPVQIMLSSSAPVWLVWFADNFLNPIAPDYLKNKIDVFGFHPTAIADYHAYFMGGFSGPPLAPGFPPTSYHYQFGLKTPGPTNYPAFPGAVDLALQHALDYSLPAPEPVKGLVFQELCIRGFAPQYQTDVDLATRNRLVGPGAEPGWPSYIGRLRWAGATSPLHVWAMSLADGTPWHPRERQAMLNRGRTQKTGHGLTHVNTTKAGVNGLSGLADIRHDPPPPPPAISFSAQVRPLVLEGGSSVLLVWSDALDDVPTHSMVAGLPGQQPSSLRPDARHRIWAKAFRLSGSTWRETPVVNLASHLGSSLVQLTPELSFRDLDDNRALPTNNPLPVRGSYAGAGAGLGNWVNDGSLYPTGYNVPLDACWGGWPIDPNPSKLPTLINTCCSSEWSPCNPIPPGVASAPRVPLVEREFLIREQLTRRIRQQFAGLSGRLSGAFRIADAGKDHFVLAFARLLDKTENSAELHYGPGQDAGTGNDPMRWSANYGDFFRNNGPHGSGDKPLKREVIIVDLNTEISGTTLTLAGSAQILESGGYHPTTAGAEAIDPEVACSPEGDTVVVARMAQDPYFLFADAPPTAEPWLGLKIWSTIHPQFGEITVPSLCGGPVNDLPIQYANPTPPPVPLWADPIYQSFLKRADFAVFHQNSRWEVYPWEPHLWMRSRWTSGPGTTWQTKGKRLAEPVFPGTDFYAETWATFLQDTHDIQLRDQHLRDGFSPPAGPQADLFFHKNWDNTVLTTPPQIDTSDPHNWHPATNASVAVGRRDTAAPGHPIPVLVAWNQVPRELRKNFLLPRNRTQPPIPAYEVRGLRLSVKTSDGSVTYPDSSIGYSKFGSSAILNPPPPGSPRVALSVRGPSAAVFRPVGLDDFGSSRAFFQMEADVYRGEEGVAAPATQVSAGQGVLRFRPPKAAVHSTRVPIPNGHPDSTVEVAAWVKPLTTGNDQTIEYQWSLPSTTGALTETRTVTNWTTTDPRVEVVAVVPYVGPPGSGWPLARIVWKADDDVYWCDAPCQPSTASQSPQRVSQTTSGDGPYPTHETEVSVSRNVILWTHDGSVLAIRP